MKCRELVQEKHRQFKSPLQYVSGDLFPCYLGSWMKYLNDVISDVCIRRPLWSAWTFDWFDYIKQNLIE